jgi:hypothetical protein
MNPENGELDVVTNVDGLIFLAAKDQHFLLLLEQLGISWVERRFVSLGLATVVGAFFVSNERAIPFVIYERNTELGMADKIRRAIVRMVTSTAGVPICALPCGNSSQ